MRSLIFASFLLVACNATETGNPSNAPTIGFSSITSRVDAPPLPADPGALVITGAPGAVVPGGGEVIAWDLDTQDAEVVVRVAEDGSFELSLFTLPTHVVRLQSVQGGYSAPVDLRVSMIAQALSLEPASCLHIEGPIARAGETVELENSCGSPIEDVTATLRASGASVAIESPIDGTISLTVPSTTARDILLVTGEVSGERVRAAITLLP